MSEITRILRAVLVVMAMLLIVACIPQAEDEEDAEAADNAAAEDDGASEAWSEGLTTEQIIKTMPVTVDISPAGTPETVSQNGVTTVRLAQETGPTGDEEELVAVQIEWSVPKQSCRTRLNCEIPDVWEVYEQDSETEEWKLLVGPDGEKLVPDIVYRDSQIDDDGDEYYAETIVYKVQFMTTYHWFYAKFYGYLKYFKVALPDHNDPSKTYESIVTFLVCPWQRPLNITLQEASASAPSRLFVEYGYDGASEELFVDGTAISLNELTLPADQPLTTETLPPNAPIKFTLRTDFSDPAWGFDEHIVIHQSNSSFAKVTKIEGVKEPGVLARFKYEFEDLPLSKKAIEANGLFDYNDLVFFVDVME